MSWVAYGLATVVLWAFWGLLGKVALRTVGWVQASLFFGGVAALAIYGVLLAARPREATWSLTDLLVPLATGFVGALGLASFYIALERGKASVVVPMVGLLSRTNGRPVRHAARRAPGAAADCRRGARRRSGRPHRHR